MKDLKKQLIKYFKSLGIEVYTNTKARGHQGFFMKNRIDISKSTREERIVPTLLHEFSHYIHDKLESNVAKTGGSLEVIFKLKKKEKGQKEKVSKPHVMLNLFQYLTREQSCGPSNESEQIDSDCDLIVSELEKELILVTHFVDENSLLHKLKSHKNQVKTKIKNLESQIKIDYPKFMRSKPFREFDKYIKKSKAKYLLKYDRVKFVSPVFRREEIFSIDNLERDFPDMPSAYCACLQLKSNQRKQARISRKINHYEKYYSKPTELFARLVEGLYLDEARVRALAPQSCQRFFELLESGYYLDLKQVFELLQEDKTLATF